MVSSRGKNKKYMGIFDGIQQGKVTRRQALSTAGKAAVGAAAVVVIGGVAYTVSQPAATPQTVTKTAQAQTVTTTAQGLTVTQTQQHTETKTVAPKIQRHGGKITVGTLYASADLDPQTTTNRGSESIIYNVYDRLLRFELGFVDGVSKISNKPSLAVGWDVSKDKKSVTIELAKGVKWHNGKDLTSADVVHTFTRILGTAAQSSFIPTLEKTEANGDYSATITTSKPYFPITTALANSRFSILPSAETLGIDEVGPDTYQSDLVGTGAFKWVGKKQDEWERLERNENYWVKDENGDQLPYLDEVEMRPVPDSAIRVNQFRSGLYDFIQQPAVTQIPLMNTTPGIQVGYLPIQIRYGLGYTHENAPFDNVKVRQAIRLATDKNEINDLMFLGTGVVTNSEYPPYSPYFHDPWGAPKQDIDGAKALLTEAGYPDGIDVDCHVFTVWDAPKLAEIIQSQVAKAGINMNIVAEDVGSWSSRMFSRNYAMTIMVHGWWMDAAIDHNRYNASMGPYKFVPTETLDNLTTQLFETFDEEKRKELSISLQKEYYDQAGMNILLWVPSPHAWRNTLHNAMDIYWPSTFFDLSRMWTESK